jgi:hypothetical protein
VTLPGHVYRDLYAPDIVFLVLAVRPDPETSPTFPRPVLWLVEVIALAEAEGYLSRVVTGDRWRFSATSSASLADLCLERLA